MPLQNFSLRALRLCANLFFSSLPLLAQTGVVTKLQLPPGKYFPGTPHTYSVYVPAQYDAARPTPFMIYMDGSGSLRSVPGVFDNLIAKHELPPMIGIFVDPGVLPPTSDAAQSRFERVFEYDSMSDRFARFLIDELIPEVGKKYNLSKDPNDRGLSGNSTGAVAAFMAAWNRPDQFRRVLSFIGTYVAMKGADSLPALIRKTEPKPIRIFLQDGKNDHVIPGQPWGTFYAGSWPINNQVMYEAFQSAGYDVRLEIGDGGHDGRQAAALMPEVLRWLWRDYPAPITVHEPAAMTQPGWDPRGKVYSTVWAAKPWEQVGETYGRVASPTGDKDGNVYFADPAANRIYKTDASGKVATFQSNTNGAHALRVAPDGTLYAAAKGRIVSYSPDLRVVAPNVDAADLAITAAGAVYYTDPTHKLVGRVGGKLTPVPEMASPAGLALSPDQAMLIVTDAQSRFSWSFQIASSGDLVNGEPFYRLELPESGWMSEIRSAVEDSIGQIYFATPLGIQVCEANGRVAQILNSPNYAAVTAIAFAGPEMNWLYAAEGGRLYRRPVRVKGVPAWTVAKLPKPPL
jgi:enterochelin esterase-like enzyme/sugar lactone lactonase YvrE